MTYTKPTIIATTRLSANLFNLLETQYDEMESIYNASNHDSLYYTQTETNLRFYKIISGLVSSADADTIDGIHLSGLLADGLPIGAICWFHGDSGDIPTGWVICDGTGGTYDLRDKFIVGKGTNYNTIGNAYGSTTQSLTGRDVAELKRRM